MSKTTFISFIIGEQKNFKIKYNVKNETVSCIDSNSKYRPNMLLDIEPFHSKHII